ncbi:MAG: hypothetical protein HQK60_20525 [Deltaproteobacteria bacterium]|nr:hypothetical protein [Deltaproteobacteria bacterium]
MEIQTTTTLRDLPNLAESLHIPMDTLFRVTIEDTKETQMEPEQKAEETGEPAEKKGKWAQVAERFRREGNLRGKSEKLNKLIREFKDGFHF